MVLTPLGWILLVGSGYLFALWMRASVPRLAGVHFGWLMFLGSMLSIIGLLIIGALVAR